MLLGMVVSWIIAPYALLHYGVIRANFAKNDVLFWVMWPATAMLVASARRMGAGYDVVERLRQLPDGTFDHVEAVWEALGGRVEYRA